MTKSLVCMGPEGHHISMADLPKPGHVRWTPKRKAVVLCAIEGGILDDNAALRMYGLSSGELYYWRRLYARQGMDGLKTTRAQQPAQREERGVR